MGGSPRINAPLSAPRSTLRGFLAVTGLALAGGEPSSKRLLSQSCSASLTAALVPCTTDVCDPTELQIGDSVTFEVCVENLSFKIPGQARTTPVAAVLQANTQMEVFLACETSECDGGSWTGPTMFQFHSYQASAERGRSSFQLGSTPTCHHAEMCGLLTPLRMGPLAACVTVALHQPWAVGPR